MVFMYGLVMMMKHSQSCVCDDMESSVSHQM